MIEELLSFRSQVERVDGSELMLRIDTVGEISLPGERDEEALLLRAISAHPPSPDYLERFPGSEDTLAIAGMTVAVKTVLDVPQDEDDWECIIDDFNALGLDFGEFARVVAEHWPVVSELLEPWGGRLSGLAAVERIAIHPAVRDSARMTVLLLQELASVLRPFEPVPFVHFAGPTAPTTNAAAQARNRARLLAGLPVGRMQALPGRWAGWVVGLLKEQDMQKGRDASHWVRLRVP